MQTVLINAHGRTALVCQTVIGEQTTLHQLLAYASAIVGKIRQAVLQDARGQAVLINAHKSEELVCQDVIDTNV